VALSADTSAPLLVNPLCGEKPPLTFSTAAYAGRLAKVGHTFQQIAHGFVFPKVILREILSIRNGANHAVALWCGRYMADPLIEPEGVAKADYNLPLVKRAYVIPEGTEQLKYLFNPL
jgi:hypothetical protein